MDEFRISQKQLTEQQRDRITRNFRAAKAIRDRKRSQLYNTPPPSSIRPNHPGADQMPLDGRSVSGSDFRSPPIFRVRKKTYVEINSGEMQREAFSELNPNTCFRPVTPRDLKSIAYEENPLMTENSCNNNGYSYDESKSGSFPSLPEAHARSNVTPVQASISEDFDDDFDDKLLKEIDALCGQRKVGDISCPETGVPQDREIEFPQDPALLIDDGSRTDLRELPGTLRRCKVFEEERILGFLSAVFQRPGDGRLEDASPSPSYMSHAKNVGREATTIVGTRKPTALNASFTSAKQLEEGGDNPSVDQGAGHVDPVNTLELLCELNSRQLSQARPVTRCGTQEAAKVLSKEAFSGHVLSHGVLSVALKGEYVGQSSAASISEGVPDGLPRSNPSPREAVINIKPKVEAVLFANGSRSDLSSGCSPLVESNTLTSEVGLSPAALTSETIPGYLQRLNLSQREAATSDITKPLLVLAGPGSGKTSTMVARLIHLLEEGTKPKSILAMTFTTAAATEMRERVGAAIGKTKSKDLAISTFHSFCLQLCRAHADKLGRTPEFLVYGSGQQRKAVIEALRIAFSENKVAQPPGVDGVKDLLDGHSENMSPSLCREQARKWQQFVTQAKCAGRTSLHYEKCGNVLGASVLRNYEKTLAACNALDYHDFISSAVELLEEHQPVLEECQKSWCCILVDEFQDTSAMQYRFLRLLGSHQRITVVGDDDQSIFGFNGANSAGFSSFKEDFPSYKEVRLHQNYRSTRCIVEAASALIRNNNKRCQTKQAVTENIIGDKIEVRECRNESAQCASVADAIIMATSSLENFNYGNIAVLYRRQVTGKLFQTTFRARKIPFNVHGVAFYRKKIIKNIIAIFRAVLPGRKDIYFRRVFKALYGGDKSESKKAVEYIEKISRNKNCDFLQAASEICTAKVSGTFTRRQLALGKKVLSSINTVKHLVNKEQSLSAVISAVVNLLPQKPIMDTRAVLSEDGRRLLNEDEDSRTVLEYLLDDVSDFLGKHYSPEAGSAIDAEMKGVGCAAVLRAFLDHITAREEENFRSRKDDNNNAVTLTTMHQSKGLEWDTVFIVKANDTEIPLLHEEMGCVNVGSLSLEEERRLFYVAMTRARKNLRISYIVVDSDRQILKPTRFLAELPRHLLDFQEGVSQLKASIITEKNRFEATEDLRANDKPDAQIKVAENLPKDENLDKNYNRLDVKLEEPGNAGVEDDEDESRSAAAVQSCLRTNAFLKGFSVEARSVVASLFHTWAKKPCFQDPKRLISKVGFIIDERLRSKGTKNKELLRDLKLALREGAALSYAQNVLAWEKLPAEERAVLQAERQELFQMQNSERSLAASAATPKQISYLRSLGCTVDPTSRLHASRLIEQYKKF